jgi:tryptophanase
VFTQSHVYYLAEVILAVNEQRLSLTGYRIVSAAPVLRHFTARLEPLKI